MKYLLLLLSYIFLTLNISTVQQEKQFTANDELRQEQILENNEQSLNNDLFPKDLSLETIFSREASLSQEEDITILVTGDINFGRSVNEKIKSATNQSYPFSNLSGLLNKSDLTLVNLESPLGENCPTLNSGMKFCANETNANRLKDAGVDIASLANNHSNDQGIKGIENTKQALIELGIKTIAQGESTIVEKKGIRIGVIGFDVIWHQVEEPELTSEIQKLVQEVDITIIFFHWGNEYQNQPNKIQRRYAKLAIDTGASLVVGNHPHWTQAIEIYNGKLIVYSHGNFVFDQLWSNKTREGIVGEYIIRNNNVVDANLIPIWIGNDYQPKLTDFESKDRVLREIEKLSYSLPK